MSDQGAATGELLPAVDWDRLPTLDAAGTFVSQHANPVDAMLVELASPHSKRVYESRLAGVARLLSKPVDVRAVPWQNLRYVHVIAIKAALEAAGNSARTVYVGSKLSVSTSSTTIAKPPRSE